MRYWGLTQQEYYKKADVWPLDPNGEIFVHPADRGYARRREPRRDAERGEGYRRDLDRRRRSRPGTRLSRASTSIPNCSSTWRTWSRPARNTTSSCGHPHVEAGNCERILQEGYRFLMCAPTRSYGHLDKARAAAGVK